MPTKFVLITDESNVAVRDNITDGLQRHGGGVGWWHLFAQGWLIYDPQGRPLEWWLDWLQRLVAPTTKLLMFHHQEPGGWGGLLPNEDAEWLYRLNF